MILSSQTAEAPIGNAVIISKIARAILNTRFISFLLTICNSNNCFTKISIMHLRMPNEGIPNNTGPEQYHCQCSSTYDRSNSPADHQMLHQFFGIHVLQTGSGDLPGCAKSCRNGIIVRLRISSSKIPDGDCHPGKNPSFQPPIPRYLLPDQPQIPQGTHLANHNAHSPL